MQYGAITTAWYKQREAAEKAGGAKIQFATFAIGDGNGVVPPLPINGLVHQVYAGIISSVEVDPHNAQQLNIAIYLPDVDAQQNTIGPFWIREIALFDEQGKQLVAATTNIEKTTPTQGQSASIKYIISIVMSDANSVQIFNTAPYVTSQELASAISHIPAYTLPTATTTRLGGMKASSSIDVDPEGVASVDLPAIENSMWSWLNGQYLKLTGGTLTGNIEQRLGMPIGNAVGNVNTPQAIQINHLNGNIDRLEYIDVRYAIGNTWAEIKRRFRRAVDNVQQGYIQFGIGSVEFGAWSSDPVLVIAADSVKVTPYLPLSDDSINVANTNFVQRKVGELNSSINASFTNYYTKPQSDTRYVAKTGDVMSGNLTAPTFNARIMTVTGVLGTYPQFRWATNTNVNFIQYLGNDGQSLGLNAYDSNGVNGKGIWFTDYASGAVQFYARPIVPDSPAGSINEWVANTRFVTNAVQGRATGSTVLHTAAGAFSGTHPMNASFAKVERWGGGGTGSSGGGGSTTVFAGSGGGGGGYCVDIIPITPGGAYSGFVGAGGDPTAGSVNNFYQSGGTTSFAGLVSAFGGAGASVFNYYVKSAGGVGHLYGADGGAGSSNANNDALTGAPPSGGGGGSAFGGSGGACGGGKGAFPGGGGGGGNGSQGYGANGCVKITY
jgi:Phage tail-collar fibre protein